MAMRNIDRLLLFPLFAALAISCSSPTSLQTSEYDDVYYSKKDKTVFTPDVALAAEPSQQTKAAPDDASVANPEYSPSSSGGGADNSATDYYSPSFYDEDDYYYASRIRRFNSPYRGFSYYDAAYTDYYWYNRNPLYYGRSIYHDPFYSYHNPYFYPYGFPPYYGSGLTIIINRPYYSRWGWGHPYFGGYYGGLARGWYGGGLYGGYGRYYGNSNWYRNDTNISRNVQYGPRRDRSVVPSGNDNSIAPNRPRRDLSDNVSGGGGVVRPDAGGIRSTRGRSTDTGNGSISQPEEPRSGIRGRIDRSSDAQPSERVLEPRNPRRSSRGRSEELQTVPTPRQEPVFQPRSGEESPSLRGRERRDLERRPSQDQPVFRPRQEQRSEPIYQPRQRSQDSYRTQPSYERSRPVYQAPQRQERSYSPPSQPSYNAPSRSSGGGGGSFDGGGRSSRGRGN